MADLVAGVRAPAAAGVSRALTTALVVIGLAALVAPAALVRFGPDVAAPSRHGPVHRQLARVVPPAELPPVEPLAVEDVDPDEARAFNAGVPFVSGPNPAARPFRLAGPADDAARAIDCLAAAAYYEAGDDAIGERAVAQVVLNRLRHPAFPKTVCGVVFQGAERATGCQFTFTCDGSIARRQPSPLAWARARDIAALALHGSVYKPVGWATHYHADFVVPYWQASLDKLAEVHTQLFYRWTGWWGTPAAFRGRLQSGEPVVAQLADLSEAHRTQQPGAAELAARSATTVDTPAVVAPPVEDGSILVALPKDTPADGYPALAAQACGERSFCRYLAWRDKHAVAAGLPLNAGQIATLDFSYVRDRSSGYERALWNCGETPRRDPLDCMKVPAASDAGAAVASRADPSPPNAPADLAGVHRKSADLPRAVPMAAPTPAR